MPNVKGPRFATPIPSSKSYPDGNTSRTGGRMTTRGMPLPGMETVRVACDYVVQARSPLTRQMESVTFKNVAQDRNTKAMLGWAVPGFGSDWDTSSDVLKCEGADYQTKSTPMMPMGVSELVGTHDFDISKIPELQRRVEEFERTGRTGNPDEKPAAKPQGWGKPSR